MKHLSLVVAILFAAPFSFGQVHGTGLLFDKAKYDKIPKYEFGSGYSDNLPESANLKGYVPSVGNQGPYGTCAGWSSTYYAMTMEYAIHLGVTDQAQIDINAFDPYFTYIGASGTKSYLFNCADGADLSVACLHLMYNGVKRSKYNELSCGSYLEFDMDSTVLGALNVSKVYGIYAPNKSLDDNINQVKQSLLEKHPVVFAMKVPKTFHKIGSDGTFTATETDLNSDLSELEGHGMTIVGYDNSINGGSFIVVNSWGANWGDSGYCYIKYEDYLHFTLSAFKFETSISGSLQSEETGCVYGDCVNGYGRYVYENGDVYEGGWSNDVRQGYGYLIWAEDNAHWSGEWSNDSRNGAGYYEGPDEQSYGYWLDDTFTPNIVVNEANYQKRFKDELSERGYIFGNTSELFELLEIDIVRDYILSSGTSGCIYGSSLEGVGIKIFADSCIYIGSFKNGQRHGYGTYYIKSGDAYRGNWSLNQMEGFGTYVWDSGNYYSGQWRSGNMHGNGTLFFVNGLEPWAGEWIEDEFQKRGSGFTNAAQETVYKDERQAKRKRKKRSTPSKKK